MTFIKKDSEFQETNEDFAQAEFYERRRSLLEDYNLGDLIDLFPMPKAKVEEIKEELIDEIINNNFDKQFNDEVK